MTSRAEWIEGARPRTLPTAVAPVLVGTGAAAAAGDLAAGPAVLALVVAVSFVIGVNFANDYSDGIRGTDDDRVGPMRLVGSRAASPAAVKRAAFGCLALGCVAGLVLVSWRGPWWLVLVGAVSVLGAWFYTGGSRPYGYRGLGEVAVFVFFGPVAVLGTQLTQAGRVTGTGVAVAAGAGLLCCAVLVANNLRDVGSDLETGKRTLAVLLGERRTRWLYTAFVVVPLLLTVPVAVAAPFALLGLLSVALLGPAVALVLRGTRGPALVPVLRNTALGLLVWAIGTTIGLVLG